MLIAEAGNNHFGDMRAAKDLIRIAKDSGADAVKFQAFLPGDFKGSMPYDFYKAVSFDFYEYLELVELGIYLNTPVFFSIFNTSLLRLDEFTKLSKLAAWQTNEYDPALLAEHDTPKTIISINSKCEKLPELNEATILFATDYGDDEPVLQRIGVMERFYKRPIGLSDHSTGLETCKAAIDLYQVPVIEKHFTLKKNMGYKGQVFRDTVHASTPSEFAKLANYFNDKKQSYKGDNNALFSLQ